MYGYKKETKMSFNQAVEKIKAELKNEGFGVLTEIDVKATLKKKLNIEYNNYVILGACNPPFAYQALQTEKEIGLLLPCNVIIYSNNNKTIISAILPTVAMTVANNARLTEIALSVEKKLKNAIDKI